jgi:Protein of unknown function (DUF1153)
VCLRMSHERTGSASLGTGAARVPRGLKGEVLTHENLPAPRQRRWVVRRKAEIVIAVDCGLLSVEEACSRYGLTLDEFLSWKRDLANGGLPGLHRARIQDHRPRRPERRIRIQAPRWR